MNKSQKGLALVTVMVILLLTMMLVLGSLRSVMFHEILQSSHSDQQRTFAAAEALLRDAEIDIHGALPETAGNGGSASDEVPCLQHSQQPHIGCRETNPGLPWFPRSNTQFEEVRDIVLSRSSMDAPCLQGICFPASTGTLTNIARLLPQLRAHGACYGQFTQRDARQQNPGWSSGNPVLHAKFDASNHCTSAQAWYWVEAFRHSGGLAGAASANVLLRPDPGASMVYRITALAQGLRPGTQVVLQSLYVPFPARQNQ